MINELENERDQTIKHRLFILRKLRFYLSTAYLKVLYPSSVCSERFKNYDKQLLKTKPIEKRTIYERVIKTVAPRKMKVEDPSADPVPDKVIFSLISFPYRKSLQKSP